MAYAMPAALRRIDLYDLHAASLVEPRSGCCFVFPGMSDSGKTSLAIRLASSGWHYLSDDLVVISEGASGIEARACGVCSNSADPAGWQLLGRWALGVRFQES